MTPASNKADAYRVVHGASFQHNDASMARGRQLAVLVCSVVGLG